jgi:SAM-dependent MidA family methyltransferase
MLIEVDEKGKCVVNTSYFPGINLELPLHGEKLPGQVYPNNLRSLLTTRLHEERFLPFDEYMGLSLYHPQFGFYQTIQEISWDFKTAPELDVTFSLAVTHDIIMEWKRSGKNKLSLVEYGAGSGINMYRILYLLHALASREPIVYSPDCARRPEYFNNLSSEHFCLENPFLERLPLYELGDQKFFRSLWDNLEVTIIEISTSLQHSQQNKLAYFSRVSMPKNPQWRPDITNLQADNDTHYYIFGNEIPDACPIKLFRKIDDDSYQEFGIRLEEIKLESSQETKPSYRLEAGSFGPCYDKTNPLIQGSLLPKIPPDLLTEQNSPGLAFEFIQPSIGDILVNTACWDRLYGGILAHLSGYSVTTFFLDYTRSKGELANTYRSGSDEEILRCYGNGYRKSLKEVIDRAGNFDITYSPDFNNSVVLAYSSGLTRIKIEGQNTFFKSLNDAYGNNYGHYNFEAFTAFHASRP